MKMLYAVYKYFICSNYEYIYFTAVVSVSYTLYMSYVLIKELYIAVVTCSAINSTDCLYVYFTTVRHA